MDRTYRIHPAIGIARLGSSPKPDGWFLGPEVPGQVHPGPFKDGPGSIKRQGARFRIFEYQGGVPVREIKAADAKITWKVHLVNRKAEGPTFPPSAKPRNAGVPAADRWKLIIDAKEQAIEGAGAGPLALKGAFLGKDVPLGDLRTDGDGRLIVLGGFGKSFSPDGLPLTGLFNNDGWCDDASDGPVSATVEINGAKVDADPAWVIVGPPDYAPAIDNVISLYDVIYEASYLRFGGHADPRLAAGHPSFTHHVFPILQRASDVYWVYSQAGPHRPRRGGDFLEPGLLRLLSDDDPNPASAAYKARNGVFRRLRPPMGGGGSEQNMPDLAADPPPTLPQYEVMARWAAGRFDADWTGAPLSAPLESHAVTEQPFLLDRAGLDACAGRAFFPSIEAPRIVESQKIYRGPLRIDPDQVKPGGITEGLALPWQTDFLACGSNWWPAQRPSNVFRQKGTAEAWERGSWAAGVSDMVKQWALLGYVIQEPGPIRFVERERDLALALAETATAEAVAAGPSPEQEAVARLFQAYEEVRARGEV